MFGRNKSSMIETIFIVMIMFSFYLLSKGGTQGNPILLLYRMSVLGIGVIGLSVSLLYRLLLKDNDKG